MGDLVLAGATSNEAGLIAAGLATALELVDDLAGVTRLEEWIEGAFEQGAALGLVGALAVGAGVALAFVVFGWLLSVVVTVLRYHGFTLTRAGDDIRREYGLLSRHHSTVPLERVQAVRIEETLLRRPLGLVALKVETAGAGPGQRGGSESEAFVPAEGCVLLSADYSQVERRVLAHLCGDTTLKAAFAAGRDIHAAVAAEVFHVPLEEVPGEQRARAKSVNFGIVYGQTSFGLARTLRISRSQAGQFIAAYKKRFPQIDEFLRSCVAQAKEQGYVETIFGRRREIREIDARNPQRRALAERLAINSVVQGSAADLIKQAMLNVDARIRRESRPSRMLLQIHDELVFEIPIDEVESERAMVVKEMTAAVELSVPLKVDTGVGLNWLDAK